MGGRFTFPAVVLSGIVAISAAITGIVLLWISCPSFPARYTFYPEQGEPRPITVHIHLPQAKHPTRIVMTVYLGMAIALACVALLLVLTHTALARGDKATEEAQTTEDKPAETDVPPPYSDQASAAVDVEDASQRPCNKGWVQAWDSLPYEVLPDGCTIFVFPTLLLGIISIAIQANNVRELVPFVNVGACGGNAYAFPTWEQLFCGAYYSDYDGYLVPDPSNKPVDMLHYGWPLTTTLGMLVVVWVSLALFFLAISFQIKADKDRRGITWQVREARRRDEVQADSDRGPHRNRSYARGGQNPAFFFFAGAGAGASAGGWGGGGGFGGGGGGGGGGGCC